MQEKMMANTKLTFWKKSEKTWIANIKVKNSKGNNELIIINKLRENNNWRSN